MTAPAPLPLPAITQEPPTRPPGRSAPTIPPEFLEAYHEPHTGRHLRRLVEFVAIYVASAALTIALAERLAGPFGWFLLAPLCLLSAAALHGISLFTHEAVHGTLCRNRVLNDVLGAVCALPVLQNGSAYRVLHLRHHRHLGEDGDPDHYENYTRWSWMVFLMNWLRLLIGYPVYIVAIPILGFRYGSAAQRVGIVAEVVALGVLAAAIWCSPVPRMWLVWGWLVPMLIINTLVNFRGMSQHTLLEEASDEVRGTRSILTGPVVRYFMCNENFHLEHHLYPGVPWHRLPEVHAWLKPELERRGAPYIPSYTAFVVEFIKGSIARSPWGRRSARPPAQLP